MVVADDHRRGRELLHRELGQLSLGSGQLVAITAATATADGVVLFRRQRHVLRNVGSNQGHRFVLRFLHYPGAGQRDTNDPANHQHVQQGRAHRAALLVVVRTPDLVHRDRLGCQVQGRKLLGMAPVVDLPPQRLPQREVELIAGKQQVQLGYFLPPNLVLRWNQILMCHKCVLSRVQCLWPVCSCLMLHLTRKMSTFGASFSQLDPTLPTCALRLTLSCRRSRGTVAVIRKIYMVTTIIAELPRGTCTSGDRMIGRSGD